MGAAPGPSPTKVATEFARVYYKVVTTLPTRLAELYGDESQLDHGPSLRASGRQSIAHLAKNLPLTGNHAEITSLIGQPSANGNVVVAVRGVYSSPPTPFVQTFLLAKQSDSHDVHFYCCNDIFLPLQSEQITHTKSDAPPREPLAEPLTPPKSAPLPVKQSNATSQSSVSSSDNPDELPSAVSALKTETATASGIAPSPNTALSTDKLSVNKAPVVPSPETPAFRDVPVAVDSDQIRSEPSPKEDPSVTNVTPVAPKLNVSVPPSEGTSQENSFSPKSSVDPAPSKSTVAAVEIRENVSKQHVLKSADANLDPNTSQKGHHSGDNALGQNSSALNDSDKSKLSYDSSMSHKAPQSKRVNRGGLNWGTSDRKSDQDYRVASLATGVANTRTPTQMKKTWASIVLSREDAQDEVKRGDESIAQEDSSNVVGSSSSNASTKAPVTEEQAANDPVVEVEPETSSPITSVANTSRATAGSNVERPRNPPKSEVENQNAHLAVGRGNGGGTGLGVGTNGRPIYPGRGSSRVFGPSAVVTLSSTGMGLSDVQALRNNLREEFSRYGHNLRGVEVKAAKGIAFIEYDTMDGVRAAVDAWAHGPRNDGVFAGVALHVSEKRSAHMGRRPSSTRGGSRGGPRGGTRRGRVASVTTT